MGFFSKLFGIDARRDTNNAAGAAQAKADEARRQAELQQAAVAKQQAEYQQSMLNMQQNAQSITASNDMNTNVATNVVAGGTADTSSILRKKKAIGAGISAQLGINV